jgi:DNA-binding NtrC family response regulator
LWYYIDTFNREFKRDVRGVTTDAMRYLESQPWPGNIRELRNGVERAMLLGDADELTVGDFSMIAGGGGPVSQEFKLPPDGIRLDELERSLVEQALTRCGGNRTRAAALLGLNRDQVRYRVEKFGLLKPEAAGAV